MHIEENVKLDFNDVLIRPKRSTLESRKNVDLNRTFEIRGGGDASWTGIPIIASNMDTVGTISMAKRLIDHNMCTALHKHYSIDTLVSFFKELKPEHQKYVFYTLGLSNSDLEKYNKFKKALYSPKMVCIDVANGYTSKFLDYVKGFREKNPDSTIMAGNVVTAEMTEALILAGVDIVKVGIGNGSACETRIVAGVGYPQLSAIIECADAAHGLHGFICSDGGCTVPGDLGKAYGAGTDFIMLGGMLAGHKESELRSIKRGEKTYYQFYGMSSETAMEKYSGGVDQHRASEGKTVLIEYKGDISKTLQYILGGVRSCMTYVGATKLKELSKRTTFVRVNRQYNTIFNGNEV